MPDRPPQSPNGSVCHFVIFVFVCNDPRSRINEVSFLSIIFLCMISSTHWLWLGVQNNCVEMNECLALWDSLSPLRTTNSDGSGRKLVSILDKCWCSAQIVLFYLMMVIFSIFFCFCFVCSPYGAHWFWMHSITHRYYMMWIFSVFSLLLLFVFCFFVSMWKCANMSCWVDTIHVCTVIVIAECM